MRKRETGFTLLELVITMGIAAILVGIGVPSYRYVTTSNRMTSELNGLVGDLQFARSEAIREGQGISVCATSDQATCSGGADWKDGWLVFVDPTNAGAIGTNPILRAQAVLKGGDTFSADQSVAFVSFNREGFATGLGVPAATFTLQDSTSNASYKRCLSISLLGLLSAQKAGETTLENQPC